MKTRCPHCKARTTGKIGSLVRCEVCSKVFEAKIAAKTTDSDLSLDFEEFLKNNRNEEDEQA